MRVEPQDDESICKTMSGEASPLIVNSLSPLAGNHGIQSQVATLTSYNEAANLSFHEITYTITPRLALHPKPKDILVDCRCVQYSH